MEQTLLNALFRAIDLAGEKAVEKAELLTGIILSNRINTLTNQDDCVFVEGLLEQLKETLFNDFTGSNPSDDAQEEYIHAYVALSKAVEYAKITAKF